MMKTSTIHMQDCALLPCAHVAPGHWSKATVGRWLCCQYCCSFLVEAMNPHLMLSGEAMTSVICSLHLKHGADPWDDLRAVPTHTSGRGSLWGQRQS